MSLSPKEWETLATMSVAEYMSMVIDLFRGGSATEQEWQAMAQAVFDCSDSDDSDNVEFIDRAVIQRYKKDRASAH